MKWENVTFEVPAQLWKGAGERIDQWPGKGLVCHSTGYMLTSRGEWAMHTRPAHLLIMDPKFYPQTTNPTHTQVRF